MKLRDRLDRIESILSEFRAESGVEMAEIKKDLAHHIYRTQLLEDALAAEKRELEPVKKTIAATWGLAKVSTFGATVAAILRVVYEVWK